MAPTRDDIFAPGLLALGIRELSINESDGTAQIPVIRTSGSDGTVSVEYTTEDDSTTAGVDYTSVSGKLTFEPGETQKTITIPILNDTLPEAEEILTFAIGLVEGTDLGVPRSALITITDNDVENRDTLTFSQGKFTVNEGDGTANIIIIRTGESNGTVSVDYAISSETALAGADYTDVTGTLTFDSGETEKTISIPLLDDRLAERDESINLVLSNPVETIVGVQGTTKLIIEDNDEPPTGFNTEILVYSGLNEPTAFTWTQDGQLLIAELGGVVHVIDNDTLLSTPFIDLSAQVNQDNQRGLLGLAAHPNFPEQPYVYLAFAYDPPDVNPDESAPRTTRLIRLTADPDTNYKTALPDSEVVLLETPPIKSFHAAGAIHFAEDGSLFFSHGDGGQVVRFFDRADADEVQSLDSYWGKLFRINPITGEGYSDNPFYNGDLTSVRSKVYNYGLRNPYRYTLHPETGEPFIGDVGWKSWEEINTGRGVNFGWPFFEGGNGVSLRTPGYANLPSTQDFYDSNPSVTPPIYASSHELGAASITLSDFYTGTTYPELYRDALFLTDFVSGEVDALLFDEARNAESATRVLDNLPGIVQMSAGPDSNLYFLQFGLGNQGKLGKLIFDGPKEPSGFIFSTDWDDLSGWNTSGTDLAIVPDGKLRLFDNADTTTRIFRSDIDIPNTYALEFTAQVEQYTTDNKVSLGAKIQDGNFRLMFQRRSDGFYVFEDTDAWVKLRTTSEFKKSADYRIEVNNGVGSLFARDISDEPYTFLGDWNLQPFQRNDLVEHWVLGVPESPAEVRFDSTRILQLDPLEEINNPPLAENDVFSNIQPGSVDNNLNVLNNDNDPDGDLLTISAVETPSNGGEVFINSTQDGLVYTPADGFVGEETFNYTIIDSKGVADQAEVRVTVGEESSEDSSVEDSSVFVTNWEDLEGWTISGSDSDTDITITETGELRLFDNADTTTRVFRSDVDITGAYSLEFKAQVDRYTTEDKVSLGVKVQDGDYRLMFQRKSDGFYVIDETNSWVKLPDIAGDFESEFTELKEYKIDVDNGSGILFSRAIGAADYFVEGEWNLQPFQQSELVEHWVHGTLDSPAEAKFDMTRIF